MVKVNNDNLNVLHVIYGSRTGNSRVAAELAHEYAKFLGMKSEIVNMQEFNPEDISNLRNMMLAVSTHGEGDPPLAAESLLSFLGSQNGQMMQGARFSVLALGDSSYRHFCKTGHDFRDNLLRLGAEEIFNLQECDIDFEEDAKKWIEGAVNQFSKILPVSEKKPQKKFAFELTRPDEVLGDAYMARVLEKRILNEANPNKHVMHISLSLKNSGIEYQPGDSIGVYSFNSRQLVDDLLRQKGYDPTHVLESKNIRTMLKQALITDYELTLLTPLVLKKYASLAESTGLDRLLKDEKALNEYCRTKDVLDMVRDFPAALTIEDFISVLRKLPPRLYSVASSPKKHPDQVDLMVGIVSFENKDREYEGVGSTFLSSRVEEGESIGIYLEENQKFRLPDPEVPIIMIGAGTGLAPFRAFLQEREATGAKGKNWLFFGEQHIASDFFYREEIEGYLEKGLLTRLDTSFSRDQKKKLYINQRMVEHSRDIYQWLEEGAVIYLCGNKNKLAVSVRKTLARIISENTGMPPREVNSYIKRMKTENRLREDVY